MSKFLPPDRSGHFVKPGLALQELGFGAHRSRGSPELPLPDPRPRTGGAQTVELWAPGCGGRPGLTSQGGGSSWGRGGRQARGGDALPTGLGGFCLPGWLAC